METSKFLKVVLCISGLVAIAIGGIILISPVDFYATNAIDIRGNVNLLNEIRAPAGALFSLGVLIFSGAFFARLAFMSTVLSTVLYLSYGVSRFAGMAVNGIPVRSLIGSAVIEVVLGLLGLFCLWKYRHFSGSHDDFRTMDSSG